MISERLWTPIQVLLSSGIGVELRSGTNGEIRAYPTSGFYKSQGSSYLEESGDEILLHGRWNERVCVSDLSDIVFNSYYWWEVTCDRNSPGSISQDPLWIPLYEKFGLKTK